MSSTFILTLDLAFSDSDMNEGFNSQVVDTFNTAEEAIQWVKEHGAEFVDDAVMLSETDELDEIADSQLAVMLDEHFMRGDFSQGVTRKQWRCVWMANFSHHLVGQDESGAHFELIEIKSR